MSGILQIGSTGANVTRIKAELRRMHYAVDSGTTFTEQTRDAVMAFQKVNGIGRDGAVGPQTRAALANPHGVSVGSGPSSRVVVDLSDQVLMLVNRGRVTSIVNACTGNPQLADGKGEQTPTGTFRVYRKVAGPDHAKLGVLYSPSYFHGGIAVHGEPNIGADPASHGCVRIPMSLAKPVYDAMHMGTQVVVRA